MASLTKYIPISDPRRLAILLGHNRRWPNSPKVPPGAVEGVPGAGVPYDYIGAVSLLKELGIQTDSDTLLHVLVPYVNDNGQVALSDEGLEELLREKEVIIALGGSVLFGPNGSFNAAKEEEGLLYRLNFVPPPFRFSQLDGPPAIVRTSAINGIQPIKPRTVVNVPATSRSFATSGTGAPFNFVAVDYAAVLRQRLGSKGTTFIASGPCHGGNYDLPGILRLTADKNPDPRKDFFAIARLDAATVPRPQADGTILFDEQYSAGALPVYSDIRKAA